MSEVTNSNVTITVSDAAATWTVAEIQERHRNLGDEGAGGVREPRRPKPKAPAGAAAVDVGR